MKDKAKNAAKKRDEMGSKPFLFLPRGPFKKMPQIVCEFSNLRNNGIIPVADCVSLLQKNQKKPVQPGF